MWNWNKESSNFYFLKNQNWTFFVQVKNCRTLDLTSLGVCVWVLIEVFLFNKVGRTTAICAGSTFGTFGAASSLPMWSARAESALRCQAMVGNTGLLSRKGPFVCRTGPWQNLLPPNGTDDKKGAGLIPWGWTGPIPESITTTIHFFSFQPTAKENCCAVVSWIFVLCFLEQAGLKLCTLLVLAVTTTSWFWFNFWSGWGESESAVREGAGLVACSSQFQHAPSHPPL